MIKPTLGKGTNMSIAKAALICFYSHEDLDSIIVDNLDCMHEIVTIAGARHCSSLTCYQVSSRLSSSPFWDKELLHLYPGFGSGWVNVYKPSEKGQAYYEKHLRKK